MCVMSVCKYVLCGCVSCLCFCAVTVDVYVDHFLDALVNVSVAVFLLIVCVCVCVKESESGSKVNESGGEGE